jgi:hypothetical protein
MYSKKFIFSAATIPAMVYMNRAADFQGRRKEDKSREANRRAAALNQEHVDITPKNGGNMPWTGKDLNQFE